MLLLGILALVDAVASEGATGARILVAMLGVLGVLGGIVMMRRPGETLLVIVIVVGLWLILSGITEAIVALMERADRGARLFTALVDFVIGILILALPKVSLRDRRDPRRLRVPRPRSLRDLRRLADPQGRGRPRPTGIGRTPAQPRTIGNPRVRVRSRVRRRRDPPPPLTSRPPTDALAATKFTPPRVPSGWVDRPRLVAMLEAGLQGPLTLLAASPGAGKSAMLGAWAAQRTCTGPLAWLSLDAGDRDRRRFWRGVLEALARGGAPEPVASLAVHPTESST